MPHIHIRYMKKALDQAPEALKWQHCILCHISSMFGYTKDLFLCWNKFFYPGNFDQKLTELATTKQWQDKKDGGRMLSDASVTFYGMRFISISMIIIVLNQFSTLLVNTWPTRELVETILKLWHASLTTFSNCWLSVIVVSGRGLCVTTPQRLSVMLPIIVIVNVCCRCR